MATIVRLKRRRNEDPVENIVVSCKKQRHSLQNEYRDDKSVNVDLQSNLKFAGTVFSKVDSVSQQIRSAIRKEKLQKEYKNHHVDVLCRSRQQQRQASKASRIKIISFHRASELDNLDKSQTTKTGSGDQKSDTKSEQSKQNHAEGVNCDVQELCEKCVKSEPCDTTSATGDTGKKEVACKTCTCKSQPAATDHNQSVFHLYDVEVDRNTVNVPTYDSVLQEARNSSNITCNSVPLVKEVPPQPGNDGDFVYDLYYTNNRDFNLRLLEDSLSIETYMPDMPLMSEPDEIEDDIYEDEDDENEESNWRNDYPDEDPHFFENEQAEYYYGDDVNENEAFDPPFNSLADWMSSRCNIEDHNDVSSEENYQTQLEDQIDPTFSHHSSYEDYYRRVKQEMDEADDSVVPD